MMVWVRKVETSEGWSTFATLLVTQTIRIIWWMAFVFDSAEKRKLNDQGKRLKESVLDHVYTSSSSFYITLLQQFHSTCLWISFYILFLFVLLKNYVMFMLYEKCKKEACAMNRFYSYFPLWKSECIKHLLTLQRFKTFWKDMRFFESSSQVVDPWEGLTLLAACIINL